ncbi:MAG: Rpn family recombination-promoting nuclease/putative transposase [Treponema sp.]|nr:Rpn family recombination-promoting nuclease/putative transposase [Treponema sp.]
MTQNERKLTPEERWEKATLADNFIFYKVMRHHPDACRHLLEMLLNVRISRMEMHNEETIDLDHDKKGIRLDIFVKEENRMYDIELQVVDTKELPKRSRYYAGLMALDTLRDGEPYKNLRDSHVIFICMEDIFNYGHPVYSFQNICTEDTDVRLNDGDFKHFFIAPLCARMIEDEELRAFFEFLISNRAGSSFTSTLRGYVEDARHNMQWRFQFMTYLRQRNYDLEEGRSQKAIEAAENFLKEKVSPEIIAKCVDLPLEKVLELKEKLQVQN